MIEKLNLHYSFTNPASVHDEEALTALELAGRQGAKINEVIEDQNKLRTETGEHLSAQDAYNKETRVEIMPTAVVDEVKRYIDAGEFDKAIDLYAGELEARINNLLGSVTEGTSTMDAEVIDIRTDIFGKVQATAGEAVRTQIKASLHGSGYNIGSTQEKSIFPGTSIDDCPWNSVVLVSSNSAHTWVNNLPVSNFEGFIHTVHFATTRFNDQPGGLQMAINLKDSGVYIRKFWNFSGSNRWDSVWTRINPALPDNLISGSEIHITADYNGEITSFDLFPVNKVIAVTKTDLENRPVDSSGLCFTFNYINSYIGASQIFIPTNGKNLYHRICWGNNAAWSEWGRTINPVELEAVKSLLNNIPETNYPPLIASFRSIAVIGDSLASGECQYTDETGTSKLVDLYESSWGQAIARKYGIKCVNLSSGGMTTRDWFSRERGYSMAIQTDNVCRSYIISLGVNDNGKLGNSYLGSASDIDITNPDNNADTYFGNYARIIQKMKAVQPKARFFLTLVPDYGANHPFNEAVKTIAGMFTHCHVIDLTSYSDMFKAGGFFGDNLRSGHYNAISYEYIGELIAGRINKYMYQHPEQFRDIEFIGTNYQI